MSLECASFTLLNMTVVGHRFLMLIFCFRSGGSRTEACHMDIFLQDVIRAVPSSGACDVQITGGKNQLCGMPASYLKVGNSTSQRLLHSRCHIAVLNVEREEVVQYVEVALIKFRIRTDYYVIIVDEPSEVPSLPVELAEFSNVIIVVFNDDLSKAVIYGDGAFTAKSNYRRPISSWNVTDGLSSSTSIFPTWRNSQFDLPIRSLKTNYLINPELAFTASDGVGKGRDVFILESIGRARHFQTIFSARFITTTTSVYNATTGQWSGPMGALIRKDNDIGVGGIAPLHERMAWVEYLTTPVQLNSVSLTFVTSPPRLASTMEGLWYGFLNPLDWTTWLGLFSACILFGGVATLVFRLEIAHRSFEVFLFILNSLTAMARSKLAPSRPSHFILLPSWFLPALVIYLAYSSSLMSSLIVPPVPRTIDTWEDLLRSEYTIIMPKDTVIPIYFQSATANTNPTYFEVWQKFSKQDQEKSYLAYKPLQLQQLITSRPGLAVVDSTMDRLMMYDKSGEQVVHISKERNYCLYDAFMIRRNYPYYDPIYSDLSWLRDTGMAAKLDDMAHLAYGDYNKMKKIQSQTGLAPAIDSQNQPLTLSNLQGGFYILLTGITIATLEFGAMELQQRFSIGKVDSATLFRYTIRIADTAALLIESVSRNQMK